MDIPSLQHINLPSGRLVYRTYGSGPPLLLLHGWGGSSRHWLGAFAVLANNHTLYAPDLPGFGESPPRLSSGGLRGLATTVLEFIDALGLETLKLAGHSLGGAIALLVAASRPQRVSQLALISFGLPRTSHEGIYHSGLSVQLSLTVALWAPWLLAWRPWQSISRPWREMAWTTPPLPALLAKPMIHHLPEPEMLSLGISDLVAMDALTALEGAASQGDPAVGLSLPRATMPTLILSGRQDPIFPPASATALAAALPGAALALIDACGHVPMAEQPGVCYQHLRAFFSTGG
ncbi:alpha/beta fold hydrolase [Candidatus Oscillochloris fontis]|uniref:alpha/beta fold hydrolase n=1 Tax=Candidatus Oscillochloris fontis TaxID=2496868 RepID=UPI0013756EB1|nr:alpha/beta hydrolase [Candidatus Oscillochloris fontis]